MPRAKIHASGTERWRATEKARLARGAVRKTIVITAEAAAALDELRELWGLEITATMSRAILETAKKYRADLVD